MPPGMEPDIIESGRLPTQFQTRGSRRDNENPNLVDCVLELENKLVSGLERNLIDVHRPDTRKLDAIQA